MQVIKLELADQVIELEVDMDEASLAQAYNEYGLDGVSWYLADKAVDEFRSRAIFTMEYKGKTVYF